MLLATMTADKARQRSNTLAKLRLRRASLADGKPLESLPEGDAARVAALGMRPIDAKDEALAEEHLKAELDRIVTDFQSDQAGKRNSVVTERLRQQEKLRRRLAKRRWKRAKLKLSLVSSLNAKKTQRKLSQARAAFKGAGTMESAAVMIQCAGRRMLAKREADAIRRGDKLEAMRLEHMRHAVAGEVMGDYDKEDLF